MKSKETGTKNTTTGWTLIKDEWVLQDGAEVLASLREEGTKRATITVDGVDYKLDTAGFWNPRITLSQDDMKIAMLSRHFLGSKATIEVNGEARYKANVRNAPLVKLTVSDNADAEIFSYRLDASLKPRTILTVNEHPIPTRERKLLLALGFFVFMGVVKENDDSNFVVMVAAAGG